MTLEAVMSIFLLTSIAQAMGVMMVFQYRVKDETVDSHYGALETSGTSNDYFTTRKW
jgi:hypothetical protein